MPTNVTDKQKFLEDRPTDSTDRDKNNNLAQELQTGWNRYAIVLIERIEIGSKSGWRMTHRT